MSTPRRLINIGICTFRRPHIADTLRSIADGKIPNDIELKVIIADNDIEPSAKPLIDSLHLPFEVEYIHAPAGNISIARNACLNAATADILIFIDDDELVTESWLPEILAEQALTNADAVLGPVKAIYPKGSPDWMEDGAFHDTLPVYVGGKIRTGYSCNALLRLGTKATRDLRFRLELGRSGGEDTVFFSELYRRGGKIAYAENALVTEEVAENRLSFDWLSQRKLRFGQTHAIVLMERSKNSLSSRLAETAKSVAKISYCGLRALLAYPNPVRRRWWLLRGTLHVGVLSKLFGKREHEAYGMKAATTGSK